MCTPKVCHFRASRKQSRAFPAPFRLAGDAVRPRAAAARGTAAVARPAVVRHADARPHLPAAPWLDAACTWAGRVALAGAAYVLLRTAIVLAQQL